MNLIPFYEGEALVLRILDNRGIKNNITLKHIII